MVQRKRKRAIFYEFAGIYGFNFTVIGCYIYDIDTIGGFLQRK